METRNPVFDRRPRPRPSEGKFRNPPMGIGQLAHHPPQFGGTAFRPPHVRTCVELKETIAREYSWHDRHGHGQGLSVRLHAPSVSSGIGIAEVPPRVNEEVSWESRVSRSWKRLPGDAESDTLRAKNFCTPVASNPKSEKKPMKPKRTLLAVLAVVVLSVIGVVIWLFLPKPPEVARRLGARLELSAGDIEVTEEGRTVKGLGGLPIARGAKVRAGAGGRAFVRTAEGATVVLREETEVVLGDGEVELLRGEVWVDVPRLESGSLRCKAGSNTVSVADAGIDVTRDGEGLRVYAARGLAVVTSAGGRVEVNAGEQAQAKPSGAPEVMAVAFWQDWTGGMGDMRPSKSQVGAGSGRLYGIDRNAPGTAARPLGIAKQSVRTVIRDGLAETAVDQTFSNPGGQPVEGWYWFTVPSTASVVGFALETDGQLVEGEIVEKKEGEAKYAAAVRRQHDPALLEWVDGRNYRARIFPIPAHGTRRVVLRYLELLPLVEGRMRYVYPLRSEDGTRFDEFSMLVDLGDEPMTVATSLDARIEDKGERVTMRRSGYVPRGDFQLEMTPKKKVAPLRVWRFDAGSDQADYLMVRYAPEVNFAKAPLAHGDVVVVVDTSAGGEESARALRVASAEAILRGLAAPDRFAVVSLDVTAKVVYPDKGLAPANPEEVVRALERLADHAVAGATDLGAMFEPSLERLHGSQRSAVVYVGDGIATSGETASEALTDRLRRSFADSSARFFAVGVGSDARHELLLELTRAGTGEYLRVDESAKVTSQALRVVSAIKTPMLTDLEVDLGAGLDQPFASAQGKLARGDEYVLLARTHHPLPKTMKVKGKLGQEAVSAEYSVGVQGGVSASLVPRLWAAEYARRLVGAGKSPEEHRSKVLELGLEYGLMTPFTSFLALDSEAAYARDGVRRRSNRFRGVRLTALESREEEATLAALFSPVPASLGGCEKRSASEKSAPAPAEQVARSKGEEGTSHAPAAAAPATAPSLASVPELSEDDDKPSDNKVADGLGRIGQGLGAGGTAKAKPAEPTKAIADEALREERTAGPKRDRVGGDRGALVRPEPQKVPLPKNDLAKDKVAPPAPPPNHPLATVTNQKKPLAACSDAASRSLAERWVLWQGRAKRAKDAAALVQVYELARQSCELPDFRDQATLLDILQARLESEEGVELFLRHFAAEPEAQKYVSRRILRRTMDVRIAAAVSRVLYGGRVDWVRVDRELLDIADPQKKLQKLREMMLVSAGDPSGDLRLVRLLSETGAKGEALSHGRRLRDRGFATPALAKELGDVLAQAGEKEEALRTYSELVEFDGGSLTSRKALGDVYLRQGWYAAAYRQYKTLMESGARDPSVWLRLASAATGLGRTDEALRLDREVVSAEGIPGGDDARQFAKLWSGARLSKLLSTSAGGAEQKEGIVRRLKDLSLFSGPGTLIFANWEDLDARVVVAKFDEKKESFEGETTDAGATGLYTRLLNTPFAPGQYALRIASDPLGRGLSVDVTILSWDGKQFQVSVRKETLRADERVHIL